jgi:hypothetical protein
VQEACALYQISGIVFSGFLEDLGWTPLSDHANPQEILDLAFQSHTLVYLSKAAYLGPRLEVVERAFGVSLGSCGMFEAAFVPLYPERYLVPESSMPLRSHVLFIW